MKYIYKQLILLLYHKLASSTSSSSNSKPLGGINSTSTTSSSAASTAVCVYCKQTIENEVQFKEHFKRHNNIGLQHQANNQANGTTKTNSFICIVCRQTLTSNSEYNLHMKHHLRRLMQTQSQVKSNAVIVNGHDKPRSGENIPSPSSTTSANNTTNATNKLKCSKCLVKFEVWQELVDHMSKAHNIRTASSSSLASSPSPSVRSTTSNSSVNASELGSLFDLY